MQSSDIPSKFPIPFANNAAAGYIRTIPSTPSGTPGQADLTLGFPPENFVPVSAGGVPPFGQDFNGIFNRSTGWNRWAATGSFPPYDAIFQTAISGYPKGACVASLVQLGLVWLSTTENNITDPDAGGAGWISYFRNSPIVKPQRTIITATGAYSFTIPQNTFIVRLSLWGAGGGGGFGNGTGSASGGSSGSYLQVTVNSTPGAAITGSVGAGGAGAATVTSGGAGGNTTAIINATTYTAAGGPGGLSSASSSCNSPAMPAKPSTGDINLQGQSGGPGILPVTPVVFSGYGGNAPIGGLGGIGGAGQPDPGTSPGAGGGGSGGGGNPGGAGARGEVWIEY